MASEARKHTREEKLHLDHLHSLVKECISKIDGVNTTKDARVYETYRIKWKGYCRIVNSSRKLSVELKSSAFDTYMDHYVKELKMKKRANKLAKMPSTSKGLLNDFFAAIVSLFNKKR